MQETDRIHFKEDKAIFSVPDNYFDNFSDNIGRMIAGEEKKGGIRLLPLWSKTIAVAISSAAVVALIVAFSIFFSNQNTEPVVADSVNVEDYEDGFDDFDNFVMSEMIAEVIYYE